MTKTFLTLTLAAFLFSCKGFSQNKKDTIPPVKTYYFSIQEPVFKSIDSILQTAHLKLGKQLYYEDAESIKGSLAAVINFFLTEAQKQNQPAIKPKDK